MSGLILFQWMFLFFFFFDRVACGILAPRPGIERVPPAMEGQSLNHWTAREIPGFSFY